MRMYEGVEVVWPPPFLASVLDDDGWYASYSYPMALYRWLGGPHRQSECYGEEKNLLPLPRIEPQLFGQPAHNLAAIPTEVCWLHFKLHIHF
jgi:hypothetical protein